MQAGEFPADGNPQDRKFLRKRTGEVESSEVRQGERQADRWPGHAGLNRLGLSVWILKCSGK
jgi:hypothetical protein